MRAWFAGIATAVMLAAGCGLGGPAPGTLYLVSGAAEVGYTPDEAKEAAAVLTKRLQVAGVRRATVLVYDAVKIEIFLPSTDPAQLGDWRLLIGGVGRLEFRPEATAAVVSGADPDQAPEGHDWLAHRSGGERLLLEHPDANGFPAGCIARASTAQGQFGGHQVNVEFAPGARAQIETYTGSLLGRRLAIVLDGEILIAPTVQGAFGESAVIEGGSAGGFSQAEAQRLAALMASGPLPGPLKVNGESQVTR